MEETFKPKVAWYKTGWGIVILAAICLIVAAALAIGALVFNYWRMIKSGQGDFLRQKFYGQQANFLTVEDEATKKARAALETTDDPYLGNPNGDLVIVEFIDLKCPICKGVYADMERLIGKYGYRVKWIVRDFPMESVHPGTSQLAEFASCANEQGGFWPVHDYFFQNQDKIGETFSSDDAAKLAESFGLNKDKISECLKSGRAKTEVNRDYADGYAYGVTRGTPVFFVNGRKVDGGIPYDRWEKMLKDLGF